MARRDIAANTAMLADPVTARFITADGKPVTEPSGRLAQRRGHGGTLGAAWLRHVRGRGEVERQIRRTRRALVYPPGWPGFEVGWGVATEFRGKGYAVEAARASIDWSFATFELDRIIHCIDRENTAVSSRRAAAGRAVRMAKSMFDSGHAASEGLWRIDRRLH